MFHTLGQLIDRFWKLVLIFWALLFLFALGVQQGWFKDGHILGLDIPRLRDVQEDGEFAYLPSNVQSLAGEKLLNSAFPDDLLKSSIVIVVRREHGQLGDDGRQFIEEVVKPRLEAMRTGPDFYLDPATKEIPLITRINTSSDPHVGKLLESADGKASLIVVALSSDFLAQFNRPLVAAIHELIDIEKGELRRQNKIPPGIDLAMSGSAAVGSDMNVAAHESAKSTELWTMLIVIVLLLLIYRAPFPSVLPLLTVFIAVCISITALILVSLIPGVDFKPFFGLEIYITVVVYGSGIDYCLFYIARYKEELDAGIKPNVAVADTLAHVGPALAASAGTVICGIGMMMFAQHGKFREAGFAIALSLCVALAAALTFTPAFLRWVGRLAFWPQGRTEHIPGGADGRVGTTVFHRLIARDRFQVLWERIASALVEQPGRIWLYAALPMLPFAIVGWMLQGYLSYGVLSELPQDKQSVIGAKAVQAHFAPGYAAPVTVIFRNDQLDFASDDLGIQMIDNIADELKKQAKVNGIADVRYLKGPLGWNHAAPKNKGAQMVQNRKARDYYISRAEKYEGHVARLDLVFEVDPFTYQSIEQLNSAETIIRNAIPANLKRGTDLYFVGPTASIRDLKAVTDHDQVKIDLLVLGVVFLILVVLLRKPAISLYLIASVFFSYLATLGVTFAVFWALDPAGFGGLDWKVPMFLFTILIAIGEDYNIFLITRIEEEQAKHGPIQGVREALLKTGGIISSCGIIMAGTFCSLMTGVLVGMQQLGFALAFGVLLDTFVVRPILVPAYLIMLYQGRFGRFSRWLGHRHEEKPNPGQK